MDNAKLIEELEKSPFHKGLAEFGKAKEFCPYCQEWDCGIDCEGEWEWEAVDAQEADINRFQEELEDEEEEN